MKKLINTVFLLLFFGAAFGQPTSGLVAYYPFNGNANDASGNGLNGTLSATPPTLINDRFGNANSAYNFNGSSNQINVLAFPAFFNNQDYSISIWIKSNGQSPSRSYNGFISYGSAIGSHSFNYAFDNAAPNFSYWDNTNGSYYMTTNSAAPKLSWTHIAIVQVGNELRNYVNGILSNSKVVNKLLAPVNFTNVLNIGSFSPDDQYFNGSIDDVRLYNRALSECEIAQLAEISLTTPVFSTTPVLTVCQGTQSNLTIDDVPGATGYEWYVNGIKETTTGKVLQKSLPVGTHSIFVRAIKNCLPTLPLMSSAPLVASINVLATPGNPSSITAKNGAIYACKDATKVYKISSVPNGTFCEWKLNGITLEGQTGNEGAVTLPNTGNNILDVRTYTTDLTTNIKCLSLGNSSLTISVKDIPENVIISDPGVVCPFYTPLLTALPNDPAYSYTWSINNSKPLASYPTSYKNGINIKFPYEANSPGSQHVVKVAVRNECGTSEATRTVTLKNPVPSLPQITCSATNSNGVCTQLMANPSNGVAYTTGATYSWKKKNPNNTETVLAATTQTLNLTVAANAGGKSYSVTVTENGCSYNNPYGECPSYLQQGNTPAVRSSAEIEMATVNSYLIYPNPSSGTVTIETKGQTGIAYVFNTFGQVVAEVQLNSNEYVYSVNLPTKGLYTFKIKADGETTGYKVVVE